MNHIQVVTYIWPDANKRLRFKSRCIKMMTRPDTGHLIHPDTLPMWNFDASSTGQIGKRQNCSMGTGDNMTRTKEICEVVDNQNTELYIKPMCVCIDPFKEGWILALCEVLQYDIEAQ